MLQHERQNELNERQAKLEWSQGALWDIGIVFRSSLYRITVFGASQYRLCGFMIAAVCEEGKRYT